MIGMETFAGLSAGAWSALAAWLTFAVLLVTLLYVIRQVGEAKQIRREQFRPHVVVDVAFRQQILAYLTVENVGNLAARDVKISFDRRPKTTLGGPAELDEVKFLREPIPTLPPGKRYWVVWDSPIELLKEWVPDLVGRLVERFDPVRIVRFGSVAQGAEGPDSDIDLLVVLPKVNDKHGTAVAMRLALADFPVPNDVFPTDPQELDLRGNSLGSVLRSALRDGRVVYERAPHLDIG